MAKKTCPNGHIYNPDIYGDQCPMCPTQATGSSSTPPTFIGGAAPGGAPGPGAGMHTHIAGSPTNVQEGIQVGWGSSPNGPTMMRPKEATPQPESKRTVIRHVGQQGPAAAAPSRKLVGFLITYNRDPNGKAYNLYEGRNFIGRDKSCDICVPDDDQMSSTHLSILYRNVDDKFKFRDEQSSNGTFVNKELIDSGELENYDIIRAGSTIFIFLAIPRI